MSTTAEECNNRSKRDICVFSFFIRLCPSHFTLHACVLNISNDNNVYHADLYRGSLDFALNKPQWMRARSTDRVRLALSVLQAELCIFDKIGFHVQGKWNLCLSIDALLVGWAFKSGAQLKWFQLCVSLLSLSLFEWISVFERVIKWMV